MRDFYVSDIGRHQIVAVTAGTAADHGGPGNGQWQFLQPAGLSPALTSGLCIADQGNNRVILADPDDLSIWQVFHPDFPDGTSLSRPTSAAESTTGDIWVADNGHRRIVCLGSDGVVATYGQPAAPGAIDAPGRFADPFSIAVDAQGRILVADPRLGRIARFDDVTGANWTVSPSNALSAPIALAVCGSHVAVADFGARRIVLLDEQLSVVITLEDRRLFGPTAVTTVNAATILVLVSTLGLVLEVAVAPGSLAIVDEVRLPPLGIQRPFGIAVSP
ncbi:NHL repeat-containing protein [Microvirga rosea]|uniref:NHL repeat-containing protein n=1 Tax=Microvirga rosea TaxID=2715425 RepID=UPI001D0BB279|nr:NHL repeat-containing protein [Microvirga rosea]MCB8823322.1 hypothetical protein [Microvirga rosea]